MKCHQKLFLPSIVQQIVENRHRISFQLSFEDTNLYFCYSSRSRHSTSIDRWKLMSKMRIPTMNHRRLQFYQVSKNIIAKLVYCMILKDNINQTF